MDLRKHVAFVLLTIISICAKAQEPIDLFSDEPRLSADFILRDDVHTDLPQRIEGPVTAFAENALELTVAEVQTDFVAADLYVLE
jgi:hypothetical protein